MKNWLSNHLYTFILTILLVIVVLSVSFTTRLANKFAEEEYRKIELWAEATRQLIMADEDDNIDLILSVMEGNTTIPVYMVDSAYQLLLSRNVKEPKHNKEEFYQQKINTLRLSQDPIVVKVNEEVTQYIYYEDSILLRRLYWFPYVQLAVIIAFIAIYIPPIFVVCLLGKGGYRERLHACRVPRCGAPGLCRHTPQWRGHACLVAAQCGAPTPCP